MLMATDCRCEMEIRGARWRRRDEFFFFLGCGWEDIYTVVGRRPLFDYVVYLVCPFFF